MSNLILNCTEDLTVPERQYEPGLNELITRPSSKNTIFERLLSYIPLQMVDENNPQLRPLAQLTTRNLNDPAIGFLNAWADVLDVLYFYQQRQLNEFYLRTATENVSIQNLGRTVSYESSPGAAASTYLSFNVTQSEGVEYVAVPTGTAAQSVPTQNQTPQTFETVEDLKAYQELNELSPYQAVYCPIQPAVNGQPCALLAGTNTQLKVGDRIMVVDNNNNPHFTFLKKVVVNYDQNYTLIQWAIDLGAMSSFKIYALRLTTGCFGNNAPSFSSVSKSYTDTGKLDWDTNPPSIWQYYKNSTEGYVLYTDADCYLSQESNELLPDSWAVLVDPHNGVASIAKIANTVSSSLAGFSLSGRVTGIRLKNIDGSTFSKNSNFALRTTTIYSQSEELPLFTSELIQPNFFIKGNTIYLDQVLTTNFEPGRTFVITGTAVSNGSDSVTDDFTYSCDDASEIPPSQSNYTYKPSYQVVTVQGTVTITPDNDPDNILEKLNQNCAITKANSCTALLLDQTLEYQYLPGTTKLYGNVALATHGETIQEVLGSGDGSKSNQTFTLKRSPLTYVSASTTNGIQTTLQVQVNHVDWQEVSTLADSDSTAQCYMTRHNADGSITVTFGDGMQGSRLPTGQENVTATYRMGLGSVGNVASNTIILLQSRPLGVNSVTNPIPAIGGVDPETLDVAQQNTPLVALTMDRIVSLTDYEMFARAFTGISKAQALQLKQPSEIPLVHLTVAGPSETAIVNTDYLIKSINNARLDTGTDVAVQNCDIIKFQVSVKVKIDDRYTKNDVFNNIENHLKNKFGFSMRNLAQNVNASEVTEAIQSINGVTAIQLDILDYVTASKPKLKMQLIADEAFVNNGGQAIPAQLLIIDPSRITIFDYE